MTYEEIEKFMKNKHKSATAPVRINFKTRKPITGLFIKTADYPELSRKNLWRIVSETYLDSYSNSKDINLARIFNGAEMTKLENI